MKRGESWSELSFFECKKCLQHCDDTIQGWYARFNTFFWICRQYKMKIINFKPQVSGMFLCLLLSILTFGNNDITNDKHLSHLSFLCLNVDIGNFFFQEILFSGVNVLSHEVFFVTLLKQLNVKYDWRGLGSVNIVTFVCCYWAEVFRFTALSDPV